MAQARIPTEVKNKVLEYVEVLKKDKLPIDEVWLFGSYAKGQAHQWSDIDVAVVSPKFNDFLDDTQYLWQKRIFDLEMTIEPIAFSRRDFRDNTGLAKEIKATGLKVA